MAKMLSRICGSDSLRIHAQCRCVFERRGVVAALAITSRMGYLSRNQAERPYVL